MAWIITKDHNADELISAPSNMNAKGMIGNRDASPETIVRLEAGEGTEFRMLDDDDNLYYIGRWLEADDCASYEAAEFQPLDDFGTPNAGATQIQYRNAQGEWESI